MSLDIALFYKMINVGWHSQSIYLTPFSFTSQEIDHLTVASCIQTVRTIIIDVNKFLFSMDLCTNITFRLVSSVLGFQVAKWFFRYSSDANFETGFDKLWSTEATQGGYSSKQASDCMLNRVRVSEFYKLTSHFEDVLC